QQPVGLSLLALRTPQTRQAGATTQLMAFRTLATGDSERAAQTGPSLGHGCSAALPQPQFAFESVDFGRVVPLACALYDHQCLSNTAQALLGQSVLPMRFGEHAEKPRPRQRCPRGPIALHALAHLANPGLYLALCGHCPAPYDRGKRQP